MKTVLNISYISKKIITNKIINTKIHTIGKQGIIMNKYKFTEDLFEKNKMVKKDFEIDEKINKIIDILENTDDVKLLLLSDNVSLMSVSNGEELSDEVILSSDINSYFTYPFAFTFNKKHDFELQIMGCIKEITGLEFAKELVLIKKNHAVKNFNIESAMKFNDNLDKLQKDIANVKDKLKGILVEIKIIEDEFVDDFNRLVVDIKEDRIHKNVDIEDLYHDYSKVVINEYFLQALEELIKSTFDGEDDIVKIINSSEKLVSLLGDNYDEVIKRLNNVGADI